MLGIEREVVFDYNEVPPMDLFESLLEFIHETEELKL